jgi:acylphosphatase
MSAVDVDGDRDLDLIAYRAENGTGRSGYSTNIFTNDGTGRFTQNNLGMPSDGLLIPLAKDNLPAQAFVHLDYYIVGSSGKYGVWNPVATLWRKDANGVDYIGQGKSDDIKGSSQSDRFSGMGGNDNFNGGSGVDTTQFRGKRSEYNIQISTNFDAVNVTDLTSSRDGNDQLQDIERLWFTDKTLAIDINGNAGQAYRLYQAALDRTPDERGLAGWIKFMDDGGALTTMAQQFIDSQEFRTKYGALDDRNFVNQLYLNVLDRNGEAAGITGWVNGLANGLTRADVLKGFSESSENQANVIGQIKNGISYQEWWLS